MYIEENKTIKDIAILLPAVSEKTLYLWAREGNWDQQREEISTTSFSALKQSMILANKKLQEMALSGEIDPAALDAVSKLAKFAERMDKNVNAYGNIILMLDELTSFSQDRYPDELEKFQHVLVEFGQEMGRKFAKKR